MNKVTAEEILYMHIGTFPVEIKGGIISAMKEYASRQVLEYAQLDETQPAQRIGEEEIQKIAEEKYRYNHALSIELQKYIPIQRAAFISGIRTAWKCKE
jgi:hypothetical protein